MSRNQRRAMLCIPMLLNCCLSRASASASPALSLRSSITSSALRFAFSNALIVSFSFTCKSRSRNHSCRCLSFMSASVLLTPLCIDVNELMKAGFGEEWETEHELFMFLLTSTSSGIFDDGLDTTGAVGSSALQTTVAGIAALAMATVAVVVGVAAQLVDSSAEAR
eukprot:CAMPEP_0182798970 /NCGR_PEP_ID=MMETSP0006_2-20121128/1636_1 /TAXON_ID=97485 /ORGANISM="Prymnesium parvum, Strain Texoma1" /LENGTH=165 /DNA_ID=CAMNT_0024924127 /DNA_START=220 /DNA_END=718 /DNA_ORIENTATION=+